MKTKKDDFHRDGLREGLKVKGRSGRAARQSGRAETNPSFA